LQGERHALTAAVLHNLAT